MKIDPKYFNLFAVIVAISGIAAIFYFTIRYSHNQQMDFIENVGEGSEVYQRWFYTYDRSDSVRAADHPDKYVVIDFWSTWSNPSVGSHEKLWNAMQGHQHNVLVIAAGVKDNAELTREYAQDHPYTFFYAEGSDAFYDLMGPGVPSQITFSPGGELDNIRIGFRGNDNYDIFAETLDAVFN